MISDADDSLCSDQLSSLRSEVFADHGYGSSQHKKSTKAILSPTSPSRLTMDDTPSSDHPGFRSTQESNFLRKPFTIPAKEKHISRAVVETEQMGLRLTEEIQRLRSELKNARDHQADISSNLRRTKAENEDLKDEIEHMKSQAKKQSKTLDEMSDENDKLRRDLVQLQAAISPFAFNLCMLGYL